MISKSVVKSLAALAHESRLQVFRTLVVAGPQGLTPGELAQTIPIPSATLSFHLKELSNAGLISNVRNGRNLHYSADFQHMSELLEYLTENCCQGQTCGVQPPPLCDC
jgi:DNA-binding transcriptional ArsR family regulator